MKPFYQDNHDTLYNLDFLKNDLPDESVQMVVTSPPYWGLRKYSGEQELIWGGLEGCKHEWVDNSYVRNNPREPESVRRMWPRGNKGSVGRDEPIDNAFCSLCGAWKGAYGLEPTPEMYVEHTIEILREVRRVLRKDGVVFWNIGDSYASGKGTCYNPGGNTSSFNVRTKEANVHPLDRGNKSTLAESGLKPKDLVMIPFRVALEAQRDGWYVRSDIIWSKNNPMPESVTDRPTNSHEHILMLTKSARYYWDADAVREPHMDVSLKRWGNGGEDTPFTKFDKEHPQTAVDNLRNASNPLSEGGRNIRSVWEFSTQPYPKAHFAVFPEKLPELCIKAATPEVGCCSECGAPWERILSKGFTSHDGESNTAYTNEEGHNANQLAKLRQAARASGGEYQNTKETLGWQPTCKCNAEKVPSVCLDPFSGAGTTAWVAKKLNRKAIGFDISEEYCEFAVERIRQQGML
jgi:DNA modification methylase